VTVPARSPVLKRVSFTATGASEPGLFDKAMELGVAAYLRLAIPQQRARPDLVRIEVMGRPEVVAQFLAFARQVR
jgi:hypothetical protein